MLTIAGTGYNYVHPEGWEISRPNGFSHFNIIHFRNSFFFDRDGKDVNAIFVDHPAYIIFRPQDPEHFYLRNLEYADDWIHFDEKDGNEDSVSKLINGLNLPFATVITIYDNSELDALHQTLAAEYWKQGPQHEQIMDSMLHTLLYKMSDLYHLQQENMSDFPTGTLESYRPRFNRLRRRIYQGGVAARISGVDELAAELHLSTSYFQHIYKALYGVPVSSDIITSRIEYASYLLQNYNRSIAEIATYCGYESIEHFNRQFKKLKGCSPTEFIKKK